MVLIVMVGTTHVQLVNMDLQLESNMLVVLQIQTMLIIIPNVYHAKLVIDVLKGVIKQLQQLVVLVMTHKNIIALKVLELLQ